MAKPTRYTQEIIDAYIKNRYWRPETLFEFWDRNADLFPNKEAVVDSKKRLTWRQAREWTDRVALAFLELGLSRDEIIVIQLPNWVELALLPVACQKSGIMALPVLGTLRHKEIEYILGHVKASAIIIPWEFRGFDYFRMVEEIRPHVPGLKHVIIAGEKVPPGTMSMNEMARQNIEEKYPKGYLKGRGFEATEVTLVRHTAGTTGFPKFAEAVEGALMCSGREWVKTCHITGEDIGMVLSPTRGGPNAANYFGAAQVRSGRLKGLSGGS